MSDIQVSVVTPFYNCAPHLARCIRSVLSQDFGGFEYLLCDNCSTDGSALIAAQAADQDSRIRHLRFEQHLSQSENYNRALLQISPSSRWCKIVQADDEVLPNCLSAMVTLGMENPSAGVISSYRSVEDRIDPPATVILERLTRGRKVARATLQDELFAFGSPTTVMYRADLVRARPDFFRPGAFFDDTDAVFDLLRESDFGFVSDVLSHTSRDAASIFGRVMSFDVGVLYRQAALVRFGRDYFDDTELAILKERTEREYYNTIVRAVLRHPKRWRYLRFHRDVLYEAARLRIDEAALLAAFVRIAGTKLIRSLPGKPVVWRGN